MSKAHLSAIVDLVEGQHERVVITRHRRPAAIMNVQDLKSLEETLEILSAPGALKEIRSAEREIDRGEYLSVAELRAKYLDAE